MTAAEQLTLDDAPTWPTHSEPADHTPTPFDCRQHEMWDLRYQGAGPAALWTAHTLPTGDLL
ncbi:MAG TPA: hypothetical protein VIP28_10390 [Nocardioides sp.]